MLRFGKGIIKFYDGHYGEGIMKVGIKEDELFQGFFIDTKKCKCGRVEWHGRIGCNMDCLSDGAGTLYYSEVEPQFYA